ncbi:MAG: tRNA lysidine(34) synthetase TilS [bacterium]
MNTQQHSNLARAVASITEQLLHGYTKPTVLLGLSGGADSVFLFHSLLLLQQDGRIQLHAIHINHGWRHDAAVDETFCEELCAQHGVTYTTEHTKDWLPFVAPHKQKTGSLEANAREIRRVIFTQHKEKLGAQFVALAHHADDQIETFFIRLIRGSGLTGLCSMQPLINGIIRPLLHCTKHDILAWLSEHNQPFCSDSTNTDLSFLRNRIRSILSPALTACDARSTHSILRTITHLQQEEDVLRKICKQTLQTLTNESGSYSVPGFLACAPALRARIITEILIAAGVGFTPSEKLFTEIIRFLDSPRGGIHMLGNTWGIQKKQGRFVVTRTLSNL